MPRTRTTTPSVPTMLRWQRIYLGQMKEMIERGAIDEKYGRRVAKGLKYTIKALEESATDYRNGRRRAEKDTYEEADKYFA